MKAGNKKVESKAPISYVAICIWFGLARHFGGLATGSVAIWLSNWLVWGKDKSARRGHISSKHLINTQNQV